MPYNLDDKTVLVTGGTGSFGQKFVETVLRRHRPRKLIIFSRDELKQYEMSQTYNPATYPAVRYFLGDVRDRNRLFRAFDGVDVVIHAAALKQVPAAEYNPGEAIQTNILGAANIIDAAIEKKVEKVMALSTDKAVNPVNLYGATKLCSDKLFVAANNYAGSHPTRFSLVRYGNVIGSRGSVVPFFQQRRKTGVLPITDERMTRFFITLDQAVALVLRGLDIMVGREIFVPKIPSMGLLDLARAIAPDCRHEIVGIRPGEKMHEVLLTEDDARHTFEYPDYFKIVPEDGFAAEKAAAIAQGGKPCPEGFAFTSDRNPDRLSAEALRKLLTGG